MSGDAALGELLQAASRFDDDTLAHLANRGLVRRAGKLLSAAEVTVDAVDDGIDVAGDGWRVTFPAGSGPIDGVCGCATAGVCQHVIAAITHLRSMPTPDRETGPQTEDRAEDPAESPADPESEVESEVESEGEAQVEAEAGTATGANTETDSLLAAIRDLEDDTIREWATTTALRWAHGRLLDLDLGGVTVEEGTNLLVDLPPPHGSIRFLGPRPDDAVAKPSGRHDARRVLLAILTVKRLAGRDGPVPPPAPAGQTELVDERRAVAERARRVVNDLVAVGLLHLGDTDRERLDSLSASARGAKLYRLSILAERASDQVAALEDLTPDADTGRLLDQLAEVATVAEVTERLLADDSPLPETLTGRARARYENVGGLRLAGVGHYPWGDRRFGGQTAVLLSDPSTGYTVTRPTMASGRSLDASLGWNGVASVGSLSGRWITVDGAAVSEDLRLSAAGSTAATIDRPLTGTDFDELAWDGSRPAIPSRLWQRASDPWRVLPVETEVHPVRFDALAQQSIWVVRSRGQEVSVVVGLRRSTAQLRMGLEAAARSGSVDHIIGRLRNAGDRLELWPISVAIDGRLVELSWKESTIDQGSPLRRFLKGIAASAAAGGGGNGDGANGDDDQGDEEQPEVDDGRLDRIGARALAMAERGRRTTDSDELRRLAGSARETGLDVLERTMVNAPSPGDAVLRTAWLLQTMRDLD